MLLEHDHVVTLSKRTPAEHLLVDVESMGAMVVATDRGGDITYHGPGQLVGYPILTVPGKRGGGLADTAAYVEGIEQLLIDVLADLGLEAATVGQAAAWSAVQDFAARPPKPAGTVVTDEGDGGSRIAAYLTEQKFI